MTGSTSRESAFPKSSEGALFVAMLARAGVPFDVSGSGDVNISPQGRNVENPSPSLIGHPWCVALFSFDSRGTLIKVRVSE